MSFASDVKKEVSNLDLNSCCLKSELYAIIKFKATMVISMNKLQVLFQTTSNNTARRIAYLFSLVYQIKAEILLKEQHKLDYKSIYIVQIKENVKEILLDLEMIDANFQASVEISDKIIRDSCCKISFLRGAFLASGSVNTPTTSNYHFEIVCPDQALADFLVQVFQEIQIEPKMIERSKGIVVYLKKAEQIGDFLRYIGAVNQLFLFEDIRIKKDLNNYVNRMMNFDVANQERVLVTSAKQLENIRLINEKMGLLNLSQRLTDAILLRNQNPDDSLAELSQKSEEIIGRYISKSGLSHCFRDIQELADSFRKK